MDEESNNEKNQMRDMKLSWETVAVVAGICLTVMGLLWGTLVYYIDKKVDLERQILVDQKGIVEQRLELSKELYNATLLANLQAEEALQAAGQQFVQLSEDAAKVLTLAATRIDSVRIQKILDESKSKAKELMEPPSIRPGQFAPGLYYDQDGYLTTDSTGKPMSGKRYRP